MQLEPYLRKQARTDYWQLLYFASKEAKTLLFENKKYLSGIQLIFLHWLRLYSQLYELLSARTSEYLDKEIIRDDLRLDAYFLLQREEAKKEARERIRTKIKSSLKGNPEKVEETVFLKKQFEEKAEK